MGAGHTGLTLTLKALCHICKRLSLEVHQQNVDFFHYLRKGGLARQGSHLPLDPVRLTLHCILSPLDSHTACPGGTLYEETRSPGFIFYSSTGNGSSTAELAEHYSLSNRMVDPQLLKTRAGALPCASLAPLSHHHGSHPCIHLLFHNLDRFPTILLLKPSLGFLFIPPSSKDVLAADLIDRSHQVWCYQVHPPVVLLTLPKRLARWPVRSCPSVLLSW